MLGWQLSLAAPLAVVGLLTARAGWLGSRALAAGARVAGPPLLAAGAVAVLGAVVTAVQPTLAAMLTVAAIAWAGALGLAVAARRLATQATAQIAAQIADQVAAQFTTQAATPVAHAACAGCPLTGAQRVACCSGH